MVNIDYFENNMFCFYEHKRLNLKKSNSKQSFYIHDKSVIIKCAVPASKKINPLDKNKKVEKIKI